MIRKALVSLGLAVLCSLANAAAVWDISLSNTFGSDPVFNLSGTFTTADANINRADGETVLSFTGTLTDAFNVDTPVSLIAPGKTVVAGPGLVFTYDDLFYGPTDPANGWFTEDAFDSDGLLLQAGSSSVNVFASGLLQGFVYSPAGTLDEIVSGTITLDHITSAVPEPSMWALYASGLFACVMVFRRRIRSQ